MDPSRTYLIRGRFLPQGIAACFSSDVRTEIRTEDRLTRARYYISANATNETTRRERTNACKDRSKNMLENRGVSMNAIYLRIFSTRFLNNVAFNCRLIASY